ncbi:MAG: CIA30 family protein [Verrucomicrobiales bacterium]
MITPNIINSQRAVAFAAFILASASVSAKEIKLASFESKDALESWTTVNDSVMGGASKGGARLTEDGTLKFSGNLSLDNNGGFSSIRTKPNPMDLSETNSILVKSCGDGRTYWVDLRVEGQMGGSSYRAALPTTAGEWKETRLPMSSFKPQAFGQDLAFKPINPSSVASVGFTLSDKKEGPFALEVEYVKAVASEASGKKKGNTIVDVAAAAGGFKTLLAAATAADLAGALSGEGPFTVLAPTDEAFAKLPKGTLETLLKPENRKQLADILKNHVIPAKVTLAKALELREGPTLLETKIPFSFEDGRVLVGASTLLKADIEASNGIIHVIDQVLIPAPSSTQPLGAAELIEMAIDRGVPMFNHGDAAACAAVYEVTAEALRSMDTVSQEAREKIGQALKKARAEKSSREQAWILRDALDSAYKSLQ